MITLFRRLAFWLRRQQAQDDLHAEIDHKHIASDSVTLKNEGVHGSSKAGFIYGKVDGTYTTDDASIGWDAFAETGKVRFVRVNTEYDKGGRTSVKYAFADDKPMFVKQQGGATVGWSNTGEAVVNEKQGGGALSDADLKSLHDSATKAFEMAQEKVDAGKTKH